MAVLLRYLGREVHALGDNAVEAKQQALSQIQEAHLAGSVVVSMGQDAAAHAEARWASQAHTSNADSWRCIAHTCALDSRIHT